MAQVIEANDGGVIPVPSELLGASAPHARFVVEVQGDALLLRPERKGSSLRETATPQGRVAEFREWVQSHERGEGPGIPHEALRRENLYD